MEVNRYHLDTIVAKTKKIIKPISRGEAERIYTDYLALIETTLFQFHQKYNLTGPLTKEILQLTLFDAKSAAEGQDYDYEAWTHEYSRECVDRIGGFFLPKKNAELQTALKVGTVINGDYLELPRKVIVRICESIDRWTKEGGADGYFNFVREFIIPEEMLRRRFLVEDRFLSGSIE